MENINYEEVLKKIVSMAPLYGVFAFRNGTLCSGAPRKLPYAMKVWCSNKNGETVDAKALAESFVAQNPEYRVFDLLADDCPVSVNLAEWAYEDDEVENSESMATFKPHVDWERRIESPAAFKMRGRIADYLEREREVDEAYRQAIIDAEMKKLADSKDYKFHLDGIAETHWNTACDIAKRRHVQHGFTSIMDVRMFEVGFEVHVRSSMTGFERKEIVTWEDIFGK